jgi:hypothetical protein
MIDKPQSNNKNDNPSGTRLRLKKILLSLALLVVIGGGAAWYIAASPKSQSPSETTKSISAPLHSNNEAVRSANALYSSYLPLKVQIVANVGDSRTVEPAAVQVVRASKAYLDPKFYNTILDEYMAEYQSSGKVTKDNVACVNNVSTPANTVFSKKSGDNAIISVTLNLTDGTTKLIPVTVDLHTLKVSKIDCI